MIRATSPHPDPLVGQVFRQTLDGPDPQYVLIADAYDIDGDPVLRIWRYAADHGFLAATEEDREWFETLYEQGLWKAIDELPREILEQVSGDEVPSEHSA